MAYRTGAGRRHQLTWVDRSGQALGTLGAPDENAALDRFPIWSPDGRIVFDSDRTGIRDLYQKVASGAGAEEVLVASPHIKVANDWSADGRFLLYQSLDPQTNRDLWVLPLEGDRTPRVFLKTPFNEHQGTFSPDGRWVVYMSNESGRNEIYVRPFAGPTGSGVGATEAGGQWQVSTAGGVFPRWRRAGDALSHAHLWRRRGHRSGPAIRRNPRRTVSDQHGAGRGGRADHAHPELGARGEEVAPSGGIGPRPSRRVEGSARRASTYPDVTQTPDRVTTSRCSRRRARHAERRPR